ncbi:protein kinase [Pseudomaricurvus sp. HS19]|uniref:protein kinase domain-containing protein n=1 Tax=Pseudomaricurvus sp. HS19 TaxID=2692626 RepID=UPI001369FF1F|nr:protein kinase [Pseudomaricurvus sp. HS19]MYM64780.1 protein kinase [Pseudomaricurvus sp. HS19]
MSEQQQNHLALPQGTEIGSYRIEAVLGMGGFGIVYKARHTLFEDRLVAIKEFLPRDMAGRHGSTVVPHTTSDQTLYDDNLERFVKEGQTLVKLQHPNVVHCIDLFKANGTAYLFMDYEDGAPLDVLIKAHESQGSRYTEEQLLAILIPLAEGLEFIHSREVIHRDIKPDNIFLRRADESPVIIDFGAARQNYLSVTQTQAPFTPFYAPAEQMDTDRSPRPTLDIHAFGGLMYRMVCGAVGPDAQKRMMEITFGKDDPLEWSRVRMAGDYSDQFLALIDQCLALRPEKRPQTMTEVRERLEQLASAEPPRKKRRAGAGKGAQASASEPKRTPSVPFADGTLNNAYADCRLQLIGRDDQVPGRSGWRLYFGEPEDTEELPQLLFQWFPNPNEVDTATFIGQFREHDDDWTDYRLEYTPCCNFPNDTFSHCISIEDACSESLQEHLQYLEQQGYRYSEAGLLRLMENILDAAPGIRSFEPGHLVHPELILLEGANSVRWMYFGNVRQPGWFREPGRQQAGFTPYDFPQTEQFFSNPEHKALADLELQRGDVYAFGAIMFRMVCGYEPPNFVDRARPENIRFSASQLKRAGYSSALGQLIDQCISLNAADRPDNLMTLESRVKALAKEASTSEPVLVKATPNRSPFVGVHNGPGMSFGMVEAYKRCRRHGTDNIAGEALRLDHPYSSWLLDKIGEQGSNNTASGSDGSRREQPRQKSTAETSAEHAQPSSAAHSRAEQPRSQQSANPTNNKPAAEPDPDPAAASSASTGKRQQKLAVLGVVVIFMAIPFFVWLNESKSYHRSGSSSSLSFPPEVTAAPAPASATTDAPLYVKTTPANARVYVLNIKPKFKQGMRLEPGDYNLQVTADGYRDHFQTVTLDNTSGYTANIVLQKIPGLDNCDGDCWNGNGVSTYSDGVYRGQWMNGKRHGEGRFDWNNGQSYDGDWRADVRTGQGFYQWTNGDSYIGGFDNGNRQGRGIYTWGDGSSYTGGWKQSKRHGSGVYTRTNGSKVEQQWQNGEQINR